MRSTAASKSKSVSASTGMQSFSIATAKAHFSEVVSEVEKRRQPVTILRRGRAVAQLVPIQQRKSSLYGAMRGTITETGDIVSPTGGEWAVEGE